MPIWITRHFQINRPRTHCLVYRLLVFVKNNGCGLDFEKKVGMLRNRGGSYFEFCKVNCVNGCSDKNGFN